MKKSKLFFLLSALLLLGFWGCEKKPIGSVEQMHWDRDMCERCKMAISGRKFAVQAIDPQNGKVYKFDDIGCSVLWMEEEKIPWRNQAILWVTDAATGQWIDARKAKYTEDSITPMAYGFAAYNETTFPKKSEAMDFNTVAKKIMEIEKLNRNKVGAYQ